MKHISHIAFFFIIVAESAIGSTSERQALMKRDTLGHQPLILCDFSMSRTITRDSQEISSTYSSDSETPEESALKESVFKNIKENCLKDNGKFILIERSNFSSSICAYDYRSCINTVINYLQKDTNSTRYESGEQRSNMATTVCKDNFPDEQ